MPGRSGQEIRDDVHDRIVASGASAQAAQRILDDGLLALVGQLLDTVEALEARVAALEG